MSSFNSSCCFFLYFLSTLCFCMLLVSGERNSEFYHVTSFSSLLPSESCDSPTDDQPSRLKVVYRHGPCSPSEQNKRLDPLVMLQQDQIRVQFMQSKVNPDTRKNKDDLLPQQTGITVPPRGSFGTGNYVLTIGLGTPKQNATVVFDTGSDLTWVQCQPCMRSCYPQQEPIFDPSRSSTFRNQSCNSLACELVQRATGIFPACLTNTCLYGVSYGDGSTSLGFLSSETLTLTPNDVFQNFVFGCGQNNDGLFGKTAGLLGLGRTELSFISQSIVKFEGLFSYCLPLKSTSTGYLSFGPSSTPVTDLQFTPLLTRPTAPSFYFIELNKITVGNHTLQIPRTVFSSPGTLIDSGTIITRLPPAVYSALRATFRKQMSQYPLSQPFSLLDTCYDFRGFENISIPKVVLGFTGSDLRVEDLGTITLATTSQVCLAFAANPSENDVVIIGNTQQRNVEVVYDLVGKRIGFRPGSCL